MVNLNGDLNALLRRIVASGNKSYLESIVFRRKDNSGGLNIGQGRWRLQHIQDQQFKVLRENGMVYTDWSVTPRAASLQVIGVTVAGFGKELIVDLGGQYEPS